MSRAQAAALLQAETFAHKYLRSDRTDIFCMYGCYAVAEVRPNPTIKL